MPLGFQRGPAHADSAPDRAVPHKPDLAGDALQVVDRLEATLRVKRFNQLGGLQLDRDVRHMVVTLSEASPCHTVGPALPSATCISQVWVSVWAAL